ncbi:MAG: bifunctional oligoribonuclease/PAP phosphatase NrnA, partial [Thermodesulfovibrionaceae bacterium]
GVNSIKDLKFLSLDSFDCLILVDCNRPKRVSYQKDIVDSLREFKGIKIVIDHHYEDNETLDFATVSWICPEVAATSVLIYYICKKLNFTLNKEIATNIYTGIIVDTGNFQFDNTSEEVFSIASECVKAGANPSFIYQQSFENWSIKRFNLFKSMLSSLEVNPPVAIAFLSNDVFKELNVIEADTERFVEFLRILKDVKIAALFREIEKGFIKVSLRSKGDIDISKIATEFGGGGHKNAAGYRISGSFEEAKMKLIEKLKNYSLL